MNVNASPASKKTSAAVSAQEFSAIMARYEPLASKSLAVAVSGGIDSMALCLLLNEWAINNNKNIHALIVDHGLRAGSEKEAKDVSAVLSKLGVPNKIFTWSGAKPKSNVQSIAREKRYEFMLGWCVKHQAKTLFVGHHRDDLIETFVQRLIRGSGIKGLSSIRAVREEGGIQIIRPLLEISKERLQVTLKARKAKWFEDETNATDKYQRNRIRKIIAELKAEGLSEERLASTISTLESANSALEFYAAKAFRKLITIMPEGYAVVDSELFGKHPKEVVQRVLRAVLNIVGDGDEIRQEKIEGFLEWINNKPAAGSKTLAGTIIFPEKNKLVVLRELSANPPVVRLKANHKVVFDNRYEAFSTLDDVKVSYLGEEGWKQIDKDFRKRVTTSPKKILYSLPAFFKDDEIACVPHINYVVDGCQQSEFILLPIKKRAKPANFA